MQFARAVSVSVLLGFLSFGAAYGQFDQNDMAADLEKALTFTKYPTYGQYVEVMQHFAASYPEICRLDTFGTTEQGRLLLALKISDNVHEDEAEAGFFYTAAMHGDELAGYPLMLRLINHLLTGYGNDPGVSGLVDSLAIWINPLANPDGTYKGGDHTVAGAIRENDPPGNGPGYDLNRSFPDISRDEPDDTTGRPIENRFMMQFLQEHRFSLSANLHAGAEVVNYPWDWTYDRHPDDAWYQLVSRDYADEVHSVDPVYMTMENNGITHGADWYIIQGSRQDYVNYYLGGREVTLELSYAYFLDSDSLESFWQKNQRSLLYYMTQATYGIRGRVTGSESGAPVAARVSVAGHDDLRSLVYSRAGHGDFYRFIKEGSYEVTFSAEGYMDRVFPGVRVSDYQAVYLFPTLDPVADFNGPGPLALPLRIWPNPVADALHIDIPGNKEEIKTLQITDLNGQIVLQRKYDSPCHTLFLSCDSLPKGVYLIRLKTAEGCFISKLIKL
ncbi:MAG: M14 family zinc carboxypeptidase [Bacteroidota bacterium]